MTAFMSNRKGANDHHQDMKLHVIPSFEGAGTARRDV